MSVKVYTAVNKAMESALIEVECSFANGFSGLQLIGSVTEVSRSGLERARVALEGVGVKIPQRRVVISMIPGDCRKDGNQFDLAFAVALGCLIQEKTPMIETNRFMQKMKM